MTTTALLKSGIFLLVLTATATLPAQEISTDTTTTTSATTVPESTEVTEPSPVETEPSLGIPGLRTLPGDGTVRAGGAFVAPEYILGRRFKLTASLQGGYDDNVNLAPGGSPSWFVNPNAVAVYQFGNPRLAVDLTAAAGVNYYLAAPGGRQYDPNIYIRLFSAYKASERLTFDLAAFASYQAQPDVTSELSANRRLGNFFRSEDNLSAHYKFTPRFTSVTSLTFSALEFEAATATALNRIEIQLGEQLRYLLLPTSTVTAGYRFGITDYQNSSQTGNGGNGGGSGRSGGLVNHSTFTVGLDQTFSPHLTGIFEAGLQLRASQTSPYGSVALRYVLDSAKLANPESSTYVLWTNRYSIEESDVAAGSGRETFRSNLLLNYAITPRLSANLAVNYLHGSGSSGGGGTNAVSNGGFGGKSEDVIDVAPGVRFAVTRQLAVNAGYRHTELDRGTAVTILGPVDLGYTRNKYFAGVSYTF